MHICTKIRTMILKRILIIVCLLNLTLLSAQNLGGVARGQRGYSPSPTAPDAGEPEKPDINLLTIERADMYQKLLGLDVFTKEVLKSYLKDYYSTTSNIGYNADIKFDEKRQLINAERKKFEKSLGEVFTEEQVEKILTEEEFGQGEKKLNKETRKEKKRNKRNKKKG